MRERSLTRDTPARGTASVRVLVADSEAATRVGVRLALEQRGMEVCAEAVDMRGAVEAAVLARPDVCLVDSRLRDGGLAAIAQIAAALPETALVVLTSSTDETELFDALRAGATGYLPKDMPPDRLPDVIRGVLRGEGALPRTLVARLIDEFRRRGDGPRQLAVPGGRSVALTAREWDVLELMRDGLATEQIARRLFISQGTVRTHVAAILRKLQVPDRESALRLLR